MHVTLWSVSYTHEWGVQLQKQILPHPLGRGQKVKYHLISITKSISKVFIPNFFVFLQIKDMKHIEWNFVLMPRSCPAVGLGILFFEHGHVAYQIDGDYE